MKILITLLDAIYASFFRWMYRNPLLSTVVIVSIHAMSFYFFGWNYFWVFIPFNIYSLVFGARYPDFVMYYALKSISKRSRRIL